MLDLDGNIDEGYARAGVIVANDPRAGCVGTVDEPGQALFWATLTRQYIAVVPRQDIPGSMAQWESEARVFEFAPRAVVEATTRFREWDPGREYPAGKLPFDHCFFGVGGSVVHPDPGEGVIAGHQVGYILCPDLVVLLTLWQEEVGEGHAFALTPRTVWSEGKWREGLGAAQGVVLSLIDLVHRHRSIVCASSRRSRSERERRRRALALRYRLPPREVPRHYYPIQLRDEVVSTSLGDTARNRLFAPPSHRWDVRRHERLRVQRGPRPLPARDAGDLRLKGYAVFERLVPDEVAGKLQHRKIPAKRSDEWLAVLTTWVAPHINGPPEAPYVPALRRAE